MFYKNLILIPALLCATAVFGQGTPKSAPAHIINAQGAGFETGALKPPQLGWFHSRKRWTRTAGWQLDSRKRSRCSVRLTEWTKRRR